MKCTIPLLSPPPPLQITVLGAEREKMQGEASAAAATNARLREEVSYCGGVITVELLMGAA